MKYQFIILLSFFYLSSIGFCQEMDSNTFQLNSLDTNKVYVIFEDDTLFYLTEDLGPFSAQERAKVITQKLEQLAEELTEVEDSFYVVDVKGFSIIYYKLYSLMGVGDEDAMASDQDRKYLAENYKEIIEVSLKNHFEDKSFKDWVIRISLTALTLIGLYLIIFLINRLFRWINNKLLQYEKSLKRERKNLFRYLAPKGPENFFIFLSNIAKFALIILVLILYLPLLFSFLPWTKGIVVQFYSYILAPVNFILDGLWAFLPNLFYIIIIVFFARYFVRILAYVSGEVEHDKLKIKGFHKDWAKPTLNILKIIIYAFALIFVFPHLPGSDSPAFQGISIFFGVLLSLGSTSAIANIVAGVVITYMRPFMIGDRVRVGETIGDVIEKSLLVTKIRTIKNEDVTIPNATIINTHLWNFTKNASELGVILHTSVTIGYNVPWTTVNKLLVDAANNTELLLKDPEPFVIQKSLNDYYVSYEINGYTKDPAKMVMIYSELHKNILESFNEEGVEILSPMYIASRDGNESTIHEVNIPDSRNPVEKFMDKQTGKEES